MNTFCSYFNQGTCSSCGKIEEEYSSQILSKNRRLSQLLESLEPFEQLPPVMSSQVGFRNKAKFSITGTMDFPIIGLTGDDDLDSGKEITQCMLHHEEVNHVLQGLPEFIRLAKLPPYQIKMKTGELKGVIVFYSPESQQMYLRLILRSKESIDRIKKHASTLLVKYPKLNCLSANIQPIAHAILEGREEIFFIPQEFIKHQILEVEMSLHPQGFVQTNHQMAGLLYTTAATWVQECAPLSFMELFSGQGAFSFFIQKHVKVAIGVEINGEAVGRANQTAKENDWKHLSFIESDAALVEELVQSFRPDLLLVNPPRRGLAEVNDLLLRAKPKYVVYSSCNPVSLAQDLERLKEHFKVVRVQVFDMFPHTDHFETLVLLKLSTVEDGQFLQHI